MSAKRRERKPPQGGLTLTDLFAFTRDAHGDDIVSVNVAGMIYGVKGVMLRDGELQLLTSIVDFDDE